MVFVNMTYSSCMPAMNVVALLSLGFQYLCTKVRSNSFRDLHWLRLQMTAAIVASAAFLSRPAGLLWRPAQDNDAPHVLCRHRSLSHRRLDVWKQVLGNKLRYIDRRITRLPLDFFTTLISAMLSNSSEVYSATTWRRTSLDITTAGTSPYRSRIEPLDRRAFFCLLSPCSWFFS